MMINIFLIILGVFLAIAFESFFSALFSFSVIIVMLLILIDKWNWKKWLLIGAIVTILVDIVLHRPIGITLLTVSVSTLILYLLFLIIPKKQIILSYIPYFFAVMIFYILIDLVTPFVQDGVWGVLTWIGILGDMVRSTISILLIFLINTVVNNFRSNQDLSL